MPTIKELRERGELQFVVVGGQRLTLRPQATMPGDLVLNLPQADGTPGQVLATDGSGNLSFQSGSGTITGGGTINFVPRYDAAQNIVDSIIQDDGTRLGIGVAPGVGALLRIDHTLAATTNCVRIGCGNASGTGILVEQPNNQVTFDVDKSGLGGGNVFDVSNLGTGRSLFINQVGAGEALRVQQQTTAIGIGCIGLSAGSYSRLLDLELGPGSTGTLLRSQSVTADAFRANVSGDARCAFFNRTDVVGTSPAVEIDNASLGVGLDVEQTGEARAVQILKSATGSQNCLDVDNAGTGNGLNVGQTGDGVGLRVNGPAITAANAVEFVSGGSGTGLDVLKTGTGRGIELRQNGTGTGVLINSGGSAINPPLLILNAGTAFHINTDAGPGVPAHLTTAGIWTNASCFRRYKERFENVDAVKFLEELSKTTIQRFGVKGQPEGAPRHLHIFQDDLVERFGFEDCGIRPGEVASLALVCIQGLVQKLRQAGVAV